MTPKAARAQALVLYQTLFPNDSDYFLCVTTPNYAEVVRDEEHPPSVKVEVDGHYFAAYTNKRDQYTMVTAQSFIDLVDKVRKQP